MPQHHCRREDHSGGIGLVLALDVLGDVAATGLKESEFTADVATRNNTGATDKGSTDVGNDGTIKIWHDLEGDQSAFSSAGYSVLGNDRP